MTHKTKLQVEAICIGTVIDHIPAGQGIKILKQLQLLSGDLRITVGFNLPSKELGFKDIIKIENKVLSENEINQLSIFAPAATINIINDYTVTGKAKMAVPDVLAGVFECPNSNCITHNEPVNTLFYVRQHKEHTQLRCKYCEKNFSKDIVTGI